MHGYAPALTPGEWIDRHQYRCMSNGKRFCTLHRAQALSRLTLGTGRGGSRWELDGEEIETIQTLPPPSVACRWPVLTLYSVDNCETVGRKRKKIRHRLTPISYYRDDDGCWLTALQLRRKYHWPADALKCFLWDWYQRPSLRPDLHKSGQMALRSKSVPNSIVGGYPTQVMGYHEGDYLAIQRGEEGDRPPEPNNRGRYLTRAERKAALAAEVVAWVRKRLARGPVLADQIDKAAADAGISLYRLRCAKHSLGVKFYPDGQTRKMYLHLPGRKPAANGPPRLTREDEQIASLLAADGPMAVPELMRLTKFSRDSVIERLDKLRRAGRVIAPQGGWAGRPWKWRAVPKAADADNRLTPAAGGSATAKKPTTKRESERRETAKRKSERREAEGQLAEDWNQAHMSGVQRKDFAHDKGISVKNLKRILNCVRMGRKRKAAHTN